MAILSASFGKQAKSLLWSARARTKTTTTPSSREAEEGRGGKQKRSAAREPGVRERGAGDKT